MKIRFWIVLCLVSSLAAMGQAAAPTEAQQDIYNSTHELAEDCETAYESAGDARALAYQEKAAAEEAHQDCLDNGWQESQLLYVHDYLCTDAYTILLVANVARDVGIIKEVEGGVYLTNGDTDWTAQDYEAACEDYALRAGGNNAKHKFERAISDYEDSVTWYQQAESGYHAAWEEYIGLLD